MISENMLRSNYLLNVDIIECVKRGTAEVLFESNDSILIRDRKADMYMISAESIGSAERAISFIPEDAEEVLAHQGFYCNLIQEKCKFKDEISQSYHVVWQRNGYIDVPKFNGQIRTLTIDNFNDIRENYVLYEEIGKKKISEGLLEGRILGAFINNMLCGFIGEHAEGSIGMLQIFPDFKRRGLGYILEAEAINKALDEGKVAFAEVIKGNESSLNLQKKVGMTISDKELYWLK